LEKAVYSLPRCRTVAPVPESKRARRPLRHLLYGKKPHIYRVIFEIDERRKLAGCQTLRNP